MNRHRPLTNVLLGLALVALATGCASDEEDDPLAPNIPPGITTLYDGTWIASFGPADYPVRRLEFEVQGGAFVHATVDSFWDLNLCPPTLFFGIRFDPRPAPIQIVNDEFSTPPMITAPQTVEDLTVTFASSTTANGMVSIALNAGGPCTTGIPMLRPFTATKR